MNTETEERVHFWCAKCADKSVMGWWVRNETGAKCDDCEELAAWVCVEPEA